MPKALYMLGGLLLISLIVIGIFDTPDQTTTFGELAATDTAIVNITQTGVYFPVYNLSILHSNKIAAAHDGFTILDSGYYKVDSQFSFSDGANNQFELKLYQNNNALEHCYTRRKLGTTGDVGSASFTCIDYFNVNDKLQVRIENTFSSTNPNIETINFNIIKISE